MKAYKIVECPKNWVGTLFEKAHNPIGRLIIPYEDKVVLIATPKIGQTLLSGDSIDRFIREGYVKETNLLNEKWVHPHLYKPLKERVYTGNF